MKQAQALKEITPNAYLGETVVMNREYGNSPNGNAFASRWVLRTLDGAYIDHDQFRNDLAERHHLILGLPASYYEKYRK